jgi:hypothetical protein
MQIVSKRFYEDLAPYVLQPLCVFKRKAARLFKNSGCIEVLSQANLDWEKLFVKQVGEIMEIRH